MEAILCYIPVLHEGYRQFLLRQPEHRVVLVLSDELIMSFRSLTKDARRIPALMVRDMLSTIFPDRTITLIDTSDLIDLSDFEKLFVPEESELIELLQRAEYPLDRVALERSFMRWDSNRAVLANPIHEHEWITSPTLERRLMGIALTDAQASSDWWRQVGAVIARDGNVLFVAHNHHVPNDLTPYLNGDPRASFKKGVHIELSTADHAESSIIGAAARDGVSLLGADLYVTTFPCPPCARLIANTGIRNLYFVDGYSMLDGESVLHDAGITIHRLSEEK